MKNGIVFLVLSWFFVYSTVASASEPQSTEFLSSEEHLFWFDINELPTIQLSFSQSSWLELLRSNVRNSNEVSAHFLIQKGAQSFELANIGVKISGNTSFTLPQQSNGDYVQSHFSLDFDEFVDDQELSGITGLRLKRFHNDSTFVREPLSNQIMHNFGVFTAHSSTYVRLELIIADQAPKYWGLYRMNEAVNRKEYIDKRFGKDNDKGHLWQANYKDYGPAHFSRIRAGWDGISESDRASFEYKGKSDRFAEAEQQLVTLAENLNQLTGQAFVDYVNKHINMSLFLKSLASEAIIGHWDGFWGNANNYQFYIDEHEVLHFIPYDTDNTLGTSALLGDAGERDPMEFGSDYLPPQLVEKVLAVQEFRDQYSEYIKQLVTQYDLMTEKYSVDWISNVHALISPHLSNVTGDNQRLADEPASWSNVSAYRLYEVDTGKNWYSTRLDAVAKSVAEQLVVETEPSQDNDDSNGDNNDQGAPNDETEEEAADKSGGSFSILNLMLFGLLFIGRYGRRDLAFLKLSVSKTAFHSSAR